MNLQPAKKPSIQHILFGISFLLILFTHLFMIGKVPYGINIDEAGVAYDAYCISHFGVDRYCQSFPVFFTNYGGGGQSPMLTYILSFLMLFFDYSLVLLRFVMACAALVTGYFGYKLVKLRYDGLEAYIYMLLFSILPIFIMYLRIGMDCAMMMPMSMVFLYFFSKAVLTGTKGSYFLAGIFGGILLYTYTLSYIVLPIMLVFSLIYLLCVQKGNAKKIFLNFCIMGIPLALLATPLIIVQIINIFQLPTLRIWKFTFPLLPWYRGSELDIRNVFGQLFTAFRFTSVCGYLPYNSTPYFGNYYYLSIPFMLIGFVLVIRKFASSFKNKKIELLSIPLLWYFSELVLACIMITEPHESRLNGIHASILYFIVVGIFASYRFVSNRFGNLSKGYVITLFAIYGALFLAFCTYYFQAYTKEEAVSADLFAAEFYPVLDYLETDGSRYADDLLCINEGGRYIYYLLATETSPYDIPLIHAKEAFYYKQFKNVQFAFPQEVDMTANYVTERKTHDLDDLGYKEVPLEHYYLYISPVSDVDITYCESETPFYIDHVTGSRNGIILNGWTLSESVGICAGETFYPADRYERPDVASAYHLDNSKPYGFIAVLPFDVFHNTASFTLETGYHTDSPLAVIENIRCIAFDK